MGQRCSITSSDYNALYSFYNSTNGRHWKLYPGDVAWVFPSSLNAPCGKPQWVGLTCTSTCVITSLSLSLRSLTGKFYCVNIIQVFFRADYFLCLGFISSSLGHLSSLQSLVLSYNALSYSIPVSLGSLSLLTVLDLSQNFLEGVIPSALMGIKNLQTFHLQNNFLVGTIPDAISQLAALTSVKLGNNQLTGSISSSFGLLSSLQYISLFSNSFFGSIPSSLGDLQSLIYLHLYSNQFTGTIPSSLGNLTSAQEIYLYGNSFNGSLPSTLGCLSNLKEMMIGTNSFTGPIPSSFGQFSSLTIFYLNSNSFTSILPYDICNNILIQDMRFSFNMFSGPIPSCLSSLSSLQILNLNSNSLTNAIPFSLGNLRLLQKLIIDNNFLSMEIPSSIGNLTNLNEIRAQENSFVGSIPDSLGNLSKLARLYLFSNYLSGALPYSLGELSSVQVLYLYSNYFTSTLPFSLGKLSSMNAFDVHTNYLSGPIPSNLGSLTKLQILYFSSNYFSSCIPTSFGNLKLLQILGLHSNHLSSSIPDTLGNQTALQSLSLFSNLLSGPIPSSLGLMSSLQLLDLYQNLLSNQIPECVSCFESLLIFDLHSNFLSGMIPSSLGGTSLVWAIDLHDNVLTGSIPSTFSGLDSLQELNLQSNSLNGPIPSAVTKLSTVSVLLFDNNFFTSISSESGKSLSVLSMSNNCMPISVLNNVCSFVSLNVLSVCKLGSNCGLLTTFSNIESFPSCIWSMPNLETFFAIGNGAQSNINEIMNSQAISIISLDSNRIYGSFPSTFSNTNMSSLQLSFNKISGVLSDSFTMNSRVVNQNFAYLLNSFHTTTFLSLVSNRLSGTLPLFVRNIVLIDVLMGNIFSCDNIDENFDEHRKEYFCGSMALTNSFLLLFSIVISIVFILIFNALPGFLERLSQFLCFEVKDLNQLFLFSKVDFRFASLIVIGGICLLSVFHLLSGSGPSYSTHEYCYGWSITVVCLHGWQICALVFVSIVSGVFGFQFWLSNGNKSCQSMIERDIKLESRSTKIILFVMGFAALIFLLSINGLYVYLTVVQQNTTKLTHTLIALLVTCSKVAMQSVFPGISFRLSRCMTREYKFIFEFFITIVIVLICPVLVTMAVDINCFLYSIMETPIVSAAFRSIGVVCIAHYDPLPSITLVACTSRPYNTYLNVQVPWIYSYQCASSIIRNYAPVILNSYFISSFAIPFVKLVVFQLPVSVKISLKSKFPPFAKLFFHLGDCNVSDVQLFKEETSRKAIISFYRHITVMLTFGIASPVIAFFVLFAFWIELFVLRIQLSMYLSEGLGRTFSEPIKASDLVFSTSEVQIILLRYFWICNCTVAAFWGIFFFDWIGDFGGSFSGMISVLIFEIIFVLICWCFSFYFFWNNIRTEMPFSKSITENDVELVKM